MFCRLGFNILVFICISGAFIPKAGAQWWGNSKDYHCEISTTPINFGLIADTDLNGKSLSTRIAARCTRDRIMLYPIWNAAYCIIIKGGVTSGAFAGTRVLINQNNRNSKIYFSFYDSQKPDLPVGEDFISPYGLIYGTVGLHLGNEVWGYFDMDFPVKATLFDSRVDKGDGSIGGGLYSNSFTAEMYYGGLRTWFPWGGGVTGGSDCLKLPQGPARSVITVQATVKSSCNISVTGNIDFGRMPDFKLASGNSAIGSISAHCSKGANYQIGFSEGLHKDKAVAGLRAMKRLGGDGADDFIAYELYQDGAHMRQWTDIWGTDGTLKGVGSDGNSLYTVYGFVPPQTGSKAAGIYQDTVIVEIHINIS